MTPQEAIKQIQFMRYVTCESSMTDGNLANDVLEAAKMAIDALAKQNKYRWHDLRKDAEDLPEDGKWCLWSDKHGNTSVERFKRDAENYFWPKPRWFDIEDAIAWRYIELFEEVEDMEEDDQTTRKALALGSQDVSEGWYES